MKKSGIFSGGMGVWGMGVWDNLKIYKSKSEISSYKFLGKLYG